MSGEKRGACRSPQESLAELKKLAQESGFELVGDEWLGAKARHCFRHIKSGMTYEGKPDNLFHKGFPKDLRAEHERSAESFQKLKQLAQKNGFELVESEWLGALVKHRFRHIESGKELEWVPSQLFSAGFPKDLRTDQDRFEQLKQLAQNNGFELLQTEWLGRDRKHRFRHIESGKELELRPNDLFRRGFPKDLRTKADKLQELIALTKGSGFELLESEWLGVKKHRFLHIASGNVYAWMPNQIKHNGFPKDLRTDADMLQELIELTKDSGFELLEDKWLGNEKQHRFKNIASGAEYAFLPPNIKKRGFPKDFRTDADKLQELVALTKGSGFELLENKWLGNNEKHRFKHIVSEQIYEWSPSQLKDQGFPLEDGQRFLTQEICRQVFVHIFGGEFKSNRNRLKSLHGKSLELDGYQEFKGSIPLVLMPTHDNGQAEFAFNLKNLQIAFEYQGHRGHREDHSVMERDRLRVKYCKQDGILLVVIDPPPKKNNVRDSAYMYAHVCKSIREAIGHLDIKFPDNFEIDLTNWNSDRAAFLDLWQSSNEKGFELLEPKWLGDGEKHRFLHIASGNVYAWVPNQIKHNGFPKDLRTKQDHLERLKQLAQDNGFELLEKEWLGAKAAHRFQHIESGKKYEGSPSQLFSRGFPNKFKRPPKPAPTPPQPEIPPGPTKWFQLNDPSGAKLKLARIDGVPLMFIVDLSPLDPKSDECVELLGFHRVPNNSFLVRRVQEGERITEDSLRKVFPMICEENMSCAELLIERPAPEPTTSDLSISPQRQQQTSRPAEPELGQLMDHETEAHADLDEPDEQEPDEQSLPVESCC